MDAPERRPDVDAPQPPAPPAQADALDTVRLEVRLEEFERRLRARSIELETELKSKERLRERELTSRVDELQDTAAALHREAASATSLARELDETLKVAAEARAQIGSALEAERSRRVELEGDVARLQKTFDERRAAEEKKARQAVDAAEQIRREGVEAFESAREALKAKAEKLKAELRARADREVAELRLALDEERARLYADVEAEREARGKRAAAPPPDDADRRSRELGEARRREIAMEVSGYLIPPPRTAAPAPAAAVPAPCAAEPPRAPLASPAPLPSMFRWDEELRLLLYVTISVLLLAAAVSGIVLYQG